jgi:hypothetical protein
MAGSSGLWWFRPLVAPGRPEDLSSPAKKLLRLAKSDYRAAISTNNDLGCPLISQLALLWAGLFIGLAIILIVIAMGVGDR